MTSHDHSSLLLDVKGAAQLLDWTEKRLRWRVARRTIPFRKDGKRVLFLREELIQFIRDLDGVRLEEAQNNLKNRNL